MQNDRPLILIVDDETKIRRLVARNLEDFGYDVVPAAGFDPDGRHDAGHGRI